LAEESESKLTAGSRGRRIVDFVIFLVTISLIVGITSSTGLLLLAPPYGVTAYLATFVRKSEFSKPEGIVLSYTVVILSTEVLKYFYGHSALAVLFNVFIVSAFISFTRFKHPPAIALTIFSYIIHTTISFLLASIVVLAIIVAIHILVERIDTRILKGM
jgi:CBS-domain-containing membrane protein